MDDNSFTKREGLNIHFHNVDIFDDNGGCAGKQFLKTWWNWRGASPRVGDIVVLKWDDSVEGDPWKVCGRLISETKETDVNVFLTKLGSAI